VRDARKKRQLPGLKTAARASKKYRTQRHRWQLHLASFRFALKDSDYRTLVAHTSAVVEIPANRFQTAAKPIGVADSTLWVSH
jgi:hypothetical protein